MLVLSSLFLANLIGDYEDGVFLLSVIAVSSLVQIEYKSSTEQNNSVFTEHRAGLLNLSLFSAYYLSLFLSRTHVN